MTYCRQKPRASRLPNRNEGGGPLLRGPALPDLALKAYCRQKPRARQLSKRSKRNEGGGPLLRGPALPDLALKAELMRTKFTQRPVRSCLNSERVKRRVAEYS
jgi:hypothetical protein